MSALSSAIHNTGHYYVQPIPRLPVAALNVWTAFYGRHGGSFTMVGLGDEPSRAIEIDGGGTEQRRRFLPTGVYW
jgi:hypothetical protein